MSLVLSKIAFIWTQVFSVKQLFVQRNSESTRDANHKLCVHIRRTDFLETPKLLPSNLLFVLNAIPPIIDDLTSIETIKNISIVIIGTDRDFKKLIFDALSNERF